MVWRQAAGPDGHRALALGGRPWVRVRTTCTPSCVATTAMTAPRPTGWNNLVFPSVGMPHVLWELQGDQAADRGSKVTSRMSHGKAGSRRRIQSSRASEQKDQAGINDKAVGLDATTKGGRSIWRPMTRRCNGWVSRHRTTAKRSRMGVWVLMFLAVF
jgi:ubiquinol-cytochrome c reductase cytochrome c1 subunit